MMKNLGAMMRQAQDIKARMEEAQSRIGTIEASGSAGGGLVEVTLSGKGDMKRLRIDPSLVSGADKDMLEDLIVAAHNDARVKVADLVQQEISKATGGLQLPAGFGLPT
jgi:DNA-binding YbaB/EbfC family protein